MKTIKGQEEQEICKKLDQISHNSNKLWLLIDCYCRKYSKKVIVNPITKTFKIKT